jgi:hypothetical protein
MEMTGKSRGGIHDESFYPEASDPNPVSYGLFAHQHSPCIGLVSQQQRGQFPG